MINVLIKPAIILLIATSLVLVSVFFLPQSSVEACTDTGGFLSFPRWYEYLDVDGDCSVQPVRYSSGDVNIGATVGAVLLAITEILLRIAGIVAVGFVVYGGILYTMSQGTPDKLQAARQTIINGIIGVAIASLAVAIVNLFSNIIIG